MATAQRTSLWGARPRQAPTPPPDPFAPSYAAPTTPGPGGTDIMETPHLQPSSEPDLEASYAPKGEASPEPASAAPAAQASGLNPTTGTIMGGAPAGGQAGQPGQTEAPADRYQSMVSSVADAADPQARAIAQDQLARSLYADLQKAGHDVSFEADGKVMIDGRPYVLADGAKSAAPPTFPRSGPAYQPGEVDMLQGFDPAAGAGGVNDALTRSVEELLANPSSMDDRAVDMLKARDREEAAEMAAQQDEDLLRFGFANGIDDSRWLASERAQNVRGRDESIRRSNRDIDIQAASQRASDKREAIGVGQGYLALKSDTAFKTAALQGDRLALRETINARAAELGLSGDDLQLEYTMGLMGDATDRYGIDVDASLTREQIAAKGREFMEELTFKFAQLEQQDDQFAAGYGLDLGRFQADEDQRRFDNALKLYGG